MIPATVTCPHTGELLKLSRARPRADDHALLQLDRRDGTSVAGQWFGDPARLRKVAAATPAPAVAVPDAGVLIQPDGADRRLSELAAYVRAPGARLVVHHPERRAVVALPDRYVKIVRPGRSAEAAFRSRLAGAALGGWLRVPEVLDHDPASGVIQWSILPGRTLHQLGSAEDVDDTTLALTWKRFGGGLAQLHATPADDLPVHTPDDERDITMRWLGFAWTYGLLPEFDAATALRSLAQLPDAPSRMVHRDLHDKQVVVDADSLGVLDLDTLSAGDPAVDIANVLVHLELRRAQGVLSPRRAAVARRAFLAGLGLADPIAGGLGIRVAAYETATRLRLRAVYAFRGLGALKQATSRIA